MNLLYRVVFVIKLCQSPHNFLMFTDSQSQNARLGAEVTKLCSIMLNTVSIIQVLPSKTQSFINKAYVLLNKAKTILI